MELKLYFLLSTRSRRGMVKTWRKRGGRSFYMPRIDLLQRLSRETGMSIEECREQLRRERDYLLKSMEW